MRPTERFVLARGGYVEQPPDLEYRPTATTFARAVERELDAGAWAAGAARGEISLAMDGGKTLESLGRERFEALLARGRPAPFGRGEQTVYDETVRRCTQIEAARIEVSGTGWQASLEGIRAALATEMGLCECDIGLEVHKLLLYREGDHFDTHADSEKSEGMIASAVVILESEHTGGALTMTHHRARARLLEGRAPAGYVQWAVWYADVAHRVEAIRSGCRVAITLNVRLGTHRPVKARPIRDEGLAESLWTRTYEDHHTTGWARRAGLEGTGGRQYARKLVWLLRHRYTEPGLKAELLKGADRQLAGVLGTQRGGERVLLGWLEVRTVGYVRGDRQWDWNDNNPLWHERRRVDWEQRAAEETEDRAGLELEDDPEDEYFEDEYGMIRVEPPEGLPVLQMESARRRDVWVEGLRTLDGGHADYGRIAVETCELAPGEAVEELGTCGARVYEATGNEGALLELQYRHAALVVWQPNESALDMLAECAGRRALAGELATRRRLGRSYAFGTDLCDVAKRWRQAMSADGGGPAPEAHRTVLRTLREGEERVYLAGIATLDLDEAGAGVVARALRAAGRLKCEERYEGLHRLFRERTFFRKVQGNRSGAEALLRRLLTDEAGLEIAKWLCGRESREEVEGYATELKREAHRETYQRRRDGRVTRDYPGDGLRDVRR